MPALHLLHHKSYHPYKADNVARVQRDEAIARGEEEEVDRKILLADSEARLDRLRSKAMNQSRDREGQGEGEVALGRQLKGLGAEAEEESGGSRIIRPEGWKGKGKEGKDGAGPGPQPDSTSAEGRGGHINFWSEYESMEKPTTEGVNLEKALAKALEKATEESFTKVYLAKKGEGDVRGWYAAADGKTERERKEGVDGGLERAYKDGEHKRLSDPLATMQAYLRRRTEVINGIAPSASRASSSRDRYPLPSPSSTPRTERGDLSPIITSLLAPRRQRGQAPLPQPPPPPLYTPSSTSRSNPNSTPSNAKEESTSRVSSERARAMALIASRRPASSIASDTPRSEDGGGFGMFNRDDTRDAAARRRGAGYSGWEGGNRDGDRGGGWAEQKRRRDSRRGNY